MSRFYNATDLWALYEAYRNGATQAELCRRSGITDKPLREWFAKFDLQYADAISMPFQVIHGQMHQLRRLVKKKAMELSILREQGLCNIPEPRRIPCAQRIMDHYGVNAVCRALEIRKSNLYYHTLRAPVETVYEKHDQELRPAILEICRHTRKHIGAERIRQQLISQGFTVSKRKVLALLRELRPRPQKHGQKPPSSNWPVSDTNLLARQFSPPAPNLAWVSDLTDIKTDVGTYYLCVIMDLYARRIIGARLSEAKDASLACTTFQDAFNTRGHPSGLTFHSDRGTQYTSNDFRLLLHICGVTQSFSAPGVPYDNAPMESFFASLKTEELNRYRYAGVKDLTDSLRDYFSFYNHIRPHSSNGNVPPAQAESDYKNQASTVKNDCAPFA